MWLHRTVSALFLVSDSLMSDFSHAGGVRRVTMWGTLWTSLRSVRIIPMKELEPLPSCFCFLWSWISYFLTFVIVIRFTRSRMTCKKGCLGQVICSMTFDPWKKLFLNLVIGLFVVGLLFWWLCLPIMLLVLSFGVWIYEHAVNVCAGPISWYCCDVLEFNTSGWRKVDGKCKLLKYKMVSF